MIKVTKIRAYEIELDGVHSVIRLTVAAKIMTLELAQEIHTQLTQLTSNGGQYAAIFDLSAVKETTIPVEVVRGLARSRLSVPMGRPHVVVGQAPVIFGLARLFQMCGEAVSKEFEVVHTMEEAYKIVEVRAEDFTQCVWDGDNLGDISDSVY